MQLTRAADYAVRMMIHLATLPPGSRINRAALAAASSVPEPFVGKILQTLTKSGMIDSQRGMNGGFALVRFDLNRFRFSISSKPSKGPPRSTSASNPAQPATVKPGVPRTPCGAKRRRP